MYSPEPGAPSIERRSVVAQVRDRLRRDITSGRLVADTLYSVTAVAAELGVSRTPVREALLQLAQLGLVQFHRNRGFTVTNVSADELIEIFQLRLAIETAAARRAATGATGTAELEAQLEAMATAAAEQDRPRFMVADRAFHECLLDIAGNRRAHDAVTVARDTLFSRGRIACYM
ncbi:MAG TPA: GntR family transcriptional regulator [Bacillota bacterium]|nr:GntR family transcriptional regulator [Bacillota bacterium]